MDKRCKICTHANLPDIDQALLDGAPFREIAAQYGVSLSSLSRHTKHLRRVLAHGAEDADKRHHTQLQDKLDLYEHRLEHIFHKAQESNTLHISLGCVQEALKIFTLRERLRQTASGQLS